MRAMKRKIETAVTQAAKELFDADVNIELTRPDEQFGGYATNVALQLAGKLKKNPREVADALVVKAREMLGDKVADVSVAGPGFINISLSPHYFVDRANNILQGDFGIPNLGQGKPVVVEYSSPNIAKPFTIGHLRSTIIGDVVANLLQAVGYTVYRDNHLGDWGTQFGKQIYAIKAWGNEAEIDKSPEPIRDLVALYVRFHEEAEKDPTLDDEARKWFKRLEDGDPEAKRLWQKCIDWTFVEFDRIYGELGVHFTENGGRGYGEAYFEGKMQPIIDELKAKGLLKESKGAQLVFFPNDEMPPLMILKNDGATLYATRDLATDKFRLEHYPVIKLVINEVGAEQALYWRQIYKIEEMLGWYKPGERVHIGHGMFRFKEGKMSTRKGNVIWLDDVLKEAVERSKTLGSTDDVTTKQVAMGAIKWNDLKRSANLDIAFDWDEILNMQGNSGPYIQYSYVRTKSLLEKSHSQDAARFVDTNYTFNSQELGLLRYLDKFAETIEQAAITYSPNVLAQYLFDLAQHFNNFYQKNRILNISESDSGDANTVDTTQKVRLALAAATGNILKKGLELLGIATPDKM